MGKFSEKIVAKHEFIISKSFLLLYCVENDHNENENDSVSCSWCEKWFGKMENNHNDC